MSWSQWSICKHSSMNFDDYEIRYENSSGDVQVRNKYKKLLSISIHKSSGRKRVSLTPSLDRRSRQIDVHRLVAYSFLDFSETDLINEVAHKNGDKLDNRADNLYFATRQQNLRDNLTHKVNCGSKNPSAVFPNDGIALLIRFFLKINNSLRCENKRSIKDLIISENQLSKRLNVSSSALYCLKNKITWSHLDEIEGYYFVCEIEKILEEYVLSMQQKNEHLLCLLQESESEKENLKNKLNLLKPSFRS